MDIQVLPISDGVVIDSGEKGPNVLILAGVHGNEKSGVYALSKWLAEYNMQKHKILCGRITCIFANIEALKKNIRYSEIDMNRHFLNDMNSVKDGYEKERIMEIQPYLQQADYVLDLHSSTAKTVPFLMCEERFLEKAKGVGSDYILTGWENFAEVSGDTETYANNHNAIAFTYEAGQHNEFAAIANAYNTLHRFLSFCGVIQKVSSECENNVFKLFYLLQKKEEGQYTFIRNFNNFDEISMGECIMTTPTEKIYAQKPSVIIFPVDPQKTKKGDDLFFLAERL